MPCFATITLQTGDGPATEYRRRAKTSACVFAIEARVLRPDGLPYGPEWYPVEDKHFLWLDLNTPVLRMLRATDTDPRHNPHAGELAPPEDLAARL